MVDGVHVLDRLQNLVGVADLVKSRFSRLRGERKETTKDFFVLDLSEVELLSFTLGDRAKCLTVLGLFQ